MTKHNSRTLAARLETLRIWTISTAGALALFLVPGLAVGLIESIKL